MKNKFFPLVSLVGLCLSATASAAPFDPAARDRAVEEFKKSEEWQRVCQNGGGDYYYMAEQMGRENTQYVRFFVYNMDFKVGQDPGDPPEKVDRNILHDDGNSHFRLGQMHEEGNGTPQNTAEAIKQYNHDAHSGGVHSYFRLARLYDTGRLGRQDLQKAASYYELGGNDFFPAVMYDDGRGVKRDPKRAFELLKGVFDYRHSSLVANSLVNDLDYHVLRQYDQVYPDDSILVYPRYRIARLYRRGEGVGKDLKEAARYMDMADMEEMCKALMYDDRSPRKAGTDDDKAITLYREGRQIENTYHNRQKADVPRAIEFYKKAADMGLPLALNRLGWYYEIGFYVQKDDAQAAALYTRSGDLRAQYRLAVLYREGRGVERDQRKAFNMMEEVVRQAPTIEEQIALGFDEEERNWLAVAASYHLAMMHEEGIGTPKDDAKALELMQRVERVTAYDFTSNDRFIKYH